MPSFSTVPALRFLMCCIAGIVLANQLQLINSEHLVSFSFCAFCSLILSLFFFRKNSYFLFFAVPALIAAFLVRSQTHYTLKWENDRPKVSSVLSYTLLEKSSKKNQKYLCRINGGPMDGLQAQFFSKNENNLEIGDDFIAEVQVYQPRKNLNPDEFNYSSYLLNRGVIIQGKVKSMRKIEKNDRLDLLVLSYKSRNSLIRKIKNKIDNDTNYGIISSLLLGYREALDDEVRQRFIESGTMHVLAISGMHIGVLAGMLFWMLKRIIPSRKYRFVRVLLIIVAIWSYTSITAFPPSAVRASLMTTLFLLGTLILVTQSEYNILFSTMLIMLFYKPSYLYDPGFQLSCAAVLSIIYFYRKIFFLIPISNPILSKIWGLTSIGLSAQLGTLGISIYHFHLFTPWFWLTGIPASILASLTMVLGLLTLGLSLISDTLSSLMSYLLNFGISALDSVVKWSYLLQWHHFDNLFWPISSIVLFYSGLICFAYFYRMRSLISLKLCGLSLVLSQSLIVIDKHIKQDQIEIVKIQGLNHLAYEVYAGEDAYTLMEHPRDSVYVEYKMQNYRVNKRVSKHKYLQPNDEIKINETIDINIKTIKVHQDLLVAHSDNSLNILTSH